MAKNDNDKTVHFLFDIGLIGKAADSIIEIIGGLVLLVVHPAQIDGLLRMITMNELGEDPHDIVANLILHAAQHLESGTQTFAAYFLLWHGAIKIGLVWALFRKHLWAYPAAIFAFGLFLAYQLYRYSHTHSVWLVALSVLDVFVIAITWLEYKRLRTSGGSGKLRITHYS
jgi:uncharacterized membrane protein